MKRLPPLHRHALVAWALVIGFCLVLPAGAAEDLTELSIEELANIEVTSVSRKPQKLSHAPTAIFVITSDDIRRSGVTNIPDALRMVPGIQVARISSSKWAITARGFNSQFANKLLVQMDGRTLYSPLFSGVFWEDQTTLLEDIDRIEVIRGPGASLWGANAVNGIINIITKTSDKTQGALATNRVGTLERSGGGARYGAPAGSMGHYRLYATYANRDESVSPEGEGSGDSWDNLQGGFRSDLSPTPETRLTFQGDVYAGRFNEHTALPSLSAPYTTLYENENDSKHMNLLSRITRTLSATSELSFQAYYDRSEKEENQLAWDGDLADLDLQHRFEPFTGHEVIWGLGYRYYADTIEFSDNFSLTSPSTTDHLISAFLQDVISLSPSVQLTLGAKVEHNDYTGMEFQPNARLLWAPNAIHSTWFAVSRAVRTPNRSETQIRIRQGVIPPGAPQNPAPLPVEVIIAGDEDLESEKLIALEAGYRLTPDPLFSLDLALFFNAYDDLNGYLTADPVPDPGATPPRITSVTAINNGMEGHTWGLEVASNWAPRPHWRLQASGTLFQASYDTKSGYEGSFSDDTDDAAPKVQFSLRSGLDLSPKVTLDLWLRHMDDIQEGTVDAYTELDARLAWKPAKGVELSLTGQNLLHESHAEFAESLLWTSPTEVERSVHVQATLTF
ncbi:TonB-dependent receptor plug domain-containing protein [Desulfoluna spongiiphila]|uniref:TonB-dependent receptor plug domain-containing protein n=1 Tax=Desulfoluna spongiiphila TaxID=419481 RepID=UPI0012570E09|nr:TonB-dependent receptor [Desulfoluna spongiiphila]VVS93290.1 consensus disorder prediction [Desulfoluna spongiiphila]